MPNSYTLKFSADAEPALRERLEERGFKLSDADHAYWRGKVPSCSVTFYRSGKLVIQGKESEQYAELLSPRTLLGDSGERHSYSAALAKHPEPAATSWVGSDESGKGDYFGPLVICAVQVDRDRLELLDELGAADCKSIKDPKLLQIAPDLASAVTSSLVVIYPERYNQLYVKMGSNLNRLLAWGHAKAIENVLEKKPDAAFAVIDKFGPEHRIERALMTRGQKLTIVQRHRAEDDPAVAVASVLARNAFLRGLRSLSNRFALPLPKGAGGNVIATGRRFLSLHGVEELGMVAKLHFKTTTTLKS